MRQNHKNQWLLLFSAILLSAPLANAEPNWTEVRFFVSRNGFAQKTEQLNALTASSNIKEFGSVLGLGMEASTPVLSWLKLGVRGGVRYEKLTAGDSFEADAPFLAVQQTYAGAILRVPVVNSKALKFDVFGEAGMTGTRIDVRTATSGSTFTQDKGAYFARAGASAGIGWDKFFLFVDGGQEWNKVGGLEQTGSATSALSSVDLGGTFVAVGVMFNGIPGIVKTK